MAQNPCEICGEKYNSFDELIDHIRDDHQRTVSLYYESAEDDEFPPVTAPVDSQQDETPVQTIVDNPESIEDLIDTAFDSWSDLQKQEFKQQVRLVGIISLLFFAVLAASTFLVFEDVLAGSAYTFLLGTLTGYLLNFLREYL